MVAAESALESLPQCAGAAKKSQWCPGRAGKGVEKMTEDIVMLLCRPWCASVLLLWCVRGGAEPEKE